ncbi:DUF5422 family protein [Chlamydia vaughanii]|uniref:DUF5422 family protein n=1 Tax=Chlamydia vaughanii TaxID=3112552 RepID=UPI0032B14AB0
MVRMNCREVCKQGSQIYFDITLPERVVARHCKNKAQQYPKTAIAIEVLVAALLGTIKIISFPLATFSAVGMIPIACLVKSITTRSCSHFTSYLMAWFISILISAIIIAAVFGSIMISPSVVFFMIGVMGAVGTSATLLNIHSELFSLRQDQASTPPTSLEGTPLPSPTIDRSPPLSRQSSVISLSVPSEIPQENSENP